MELRDEDPPLRSTPSRVGPGVAGRKGWRSNLEEKWTGLNRTDNERVCNVIFVCMYLCAYLCTYDARVTAQKEKNVRGYEQGPLERLMDAFGLDGLSQRSK